MLSDNDDNIFETEQSVFPIVRFNKKTEEFTCLGSGFFITGFGGFVTAKHVLSDNQVNYHKKLYAIQRQNNNCVTRTVKHIIYHPNADIAIGIFDDKGRNGKAEIVDFDPGSKFRLSFKPLNVNDKILAFGYPKTERTVYESEYTFKFRGKWCEGFIESFCKEGSHLVKNRCYQTNMFFDTGASGSPVFKDGNVVAINSSSMDCENPFSFITPVDFLLDLQMPDHCKKKSFKELVSDGVIDAVF